MAKILLTRFWCLAVIMSVMISIGFSNDRKSKDDDVLIGNLSFVGIVSSAMCYCEMSSALHLCSWWTFNGNTSSLNKYDSKDGPFHPIKVTVYDHFVARLEQGPSKNSCEGYVSIKNILYKEGYVVYHYPAQNRSINWDICSKMHDRNTAGCNYTFAVVSVQNDSRGFLPSGGEYFHYFSAFGSGSSHLRLSTMYNVSVHFNKNSPEKVQFSQVNNTIQQSKVENNVLPIPVKKPTLSPSKFGLTTIKYAHTTELGIPESTACMVAPSNFIRAINFLSILSALCWHAEI